MNLTIDTLIWADPCHVLINGFTLRHVFPYSGSYRAQLKSILKFIFK